MSRRSVRHRNSEAELSRTFLGGAITDAYPCRVTAAQVCGERDAQCVQLKHPGYAPRFAAKHERVGDGVALDEAFAHAIAQRRFAFSDGLIMCGKKQGRAATRNPSPAFNFSSLVFVFWLEMCW
jgi:hypothetical protein